MLGQTLKKKSFALILPNLIHINQSKSTVEFDYSYLVLLGSGRPVLFKEEENQLYLFGPRGARQTHTFFVLFQKQEVACFYYFKMAGKDSFDLSSQSGTLCLLPTLSVCLSLCLSVCVSVPLLRLTSRLLWVGF